MSIEPHSGIAERKPAAQRQLPGGAGKTCQCPVQSAPMGSAERHATVLSIIMYCRVIGNNYFFRPARVVDVDQARSDRGAAGSPSPRRRCSPTPRAQDEERHQDPLARDGMGEAAHLARVVDETLLAGAVDLTHGEPAASEPRR